MMTMQNKTLGQQFLEVLNAAKNDKEKMFTLLRSTLEKVNPFPSKKVDFSAIMANVSNMESVASIKAVKANFNASHGAYMFAEDYIYLTADVYKKNGLGGIAEFKSEFEKFAKKTNNTKTEEKNEVLNIALGQRSVVNA